MFTQDIIDESVYWKWHELLSMFTDVNDEIKNKLCIQTTEFFNILKMTFTDEDYENNESDEDDEENNNNEDNDKQEADSEPEPEPETDDKYKVPEEQDWNMDDI